MTSAPHGIRSFWQCDWRHREMYENHDWDHDTTTAATIEELYDKLASSRLDLVYACPLDEVEHDTTPLEAIEFRYGPIRRIVVQEEIRCDEALIENSNFWNGFRERIEEGRRREEDEENARRAEDAALSKENERAEYERLHRIYGASS